MIIPQLLISTIPTIFTRLIDFLPQNEMNRLMMKEEQEIKTKMGFQTNNSSDKQSKTKNGYENELNNDMARLNQGPGSLQERRESFRKSKTFMPMSVSGALPPLTIAQRTANSLASLGGLL